MPLNGSRTEPTPADRHTTTPHAALTRIARLAAGWHLPRVMEDEPATFERVLERLAGGTAS